MSSFLLIVSFSANIILLSVAQVELYADYDPKMLLHFLESNQHYTLDKDWDLPVIDRYIFACRWTKLSKLFLGLYEIGIKRDQMREQVIIFEAW